MARVLVSSNLSATLIPTSSLRFSSAFSSLPKSASLSCSAAAVVSRYFAAKIPASSLSSSVYETRQTDPSANEKDLEIRKNILACPICYGTFIWNGDPVSSRDSAVWSSLKCSTCRKTYRGNEHIDLTIASGTKAYAEYIPASSELFRFPLVSFLYERGWGQSFSVLGGFPGPEEEFELMKSYLKPILGGMIIDASCGSGMFSRIFAKSVLFSLVIALDFSETMLQQCYEFINQEKNFPKENLILVRTDISRLPFASRSVDAVHAGAALHCWPSPSAGVAEISRVLRAGGVFVAMTYILDGPFSYSPLLAPLRQNIGQISGSHIFLSNHELEDLCTSCGLVDFTCVRNRRFVMISARKPT